MSTRIYGGAACARPGVRRPSALLPGCPMLLLGLLLAARAYAFSDEIDVFTGDIARPGVFDVTLHDYYLADSGRPADFPGGLSPDHSFTGGTEWAYGAKPWLELGVYTPIYTVTGDAAGHIDGAEIRALFVTPPDERRFVYGLNVALEMSAAAWDPHRRSLELRPVLSWRSGRWRLSVNPILDTAFDGLSALQLTPAERLDYTLSPAWQIGVEEYADDTGTIGQLLAMRDQDQRLFAVADARLGRWTIEPGLGIGLTHASDHLTVKLILSRDLP